MHSKSENINFVIWICLVSGVVTGCGTEPEQEPAIVIELDMSSQEDMPVREDLAQPDQRAEMPDMSVLDDAGEVSEDMAPQGCEAPELPAKLELAVGQSASVIVPTSHRIVNISNPSLTTWRPEQDAQRVELRADYKAGAHTLTLSLECVANSAPSSHEIEVSVSALQVDYVQDWGDANGPVRREHAPLLFHPQDPDAMYMYGGLAYQPRQFTVITDFWRFDRVSRTWSEVQVEGEAPPVATGRFVYAAQREAFLTVGGDDVLGDVVNTKLYELERDDERGVWSWSNREVDGALEHTLGALVYDDREDRLIATLGFGGIGATGYTFFDGAAALDLGTDSSAWRPLVWGMRAPSPRYGFAYFVDPVSERLVVTGGAQGLRAINPAKDTWAYDWRENTWEQLDEVNVGGVFALGKRHDGGRNSCWAFDPVNRRLFVWGGTPDGRSISTGLYAMHMDEPGRVRWYEVSLEGFPETRASCSGGYNPARGEVYFGFGNSDRGVYQDLVFVDVHDPL